MTPTPTAATAAPALAVGPLLAGSSLLLDRYAITLEQLGRPEISGELEPRYAPLLSADELTAERATLQHAYDTVRAHYSQTQALERQAREEKKHAISQALSASDAELAAAERTADAEIAQLAAALRAAKAAKAARIGELRSARLQQVAALRAETDAKIARYDSEGRALATQLADAYRAADESYRAAEGIWTANCNEKSKRGLVRQVFPRIARGAASRPSGSSTTAAHPAQTPA